MRTGNAPFQNVMPGGSGSGIAGNAMHNMFTPPIGGPPPVSSNALMKPPYIGSSDVTGLSPAEIYCQQHEVTATVCIFSWLLYLVFFLKYLEFLIQIACGWFDMTKLLQAPRQT